MIALSIKQPYAALILLPSSDPRHKRIENRDWKRSIRGNFLIHTGKSPDREGMADYPNIPGAEVRGAIVGMAELYDIKAFLDISQYSSMRHAFGPWCFMLRNIKRLDNPIPYRGELGFFGVPDSVFSGREFIPVD